MIVYIAVGGGLGHLTRTKACIYTLGLTSPITLFTAHTDLSCITFEPHIQIQQIPTYLAQDKEHYRSWWLHQLNILQPTDIFLDAFPFGICGEWTPIEHLKSICPTASIHYIARLLRWKTYCAASQIEPLQNRSRLLFHSTYVMEPLTSEHQDFIMNVSHNIHSLQLIDPPVPSHHTIETSTHKRIFSKQQNMDASYCLVIHSYPEDEILELVEYAQDKIQSEQIDLPLLIVSPQRPQRLPEKTEHTALYPATPLFERAHWIITAGGFNSMRQLRAYAHKHFPLPMLRRFDDQYTRVRRWREWRCNVL